MFNKLFKAIFNPIKSNPAVAKRTYWIAWAPGQLYFKGRNGEGEMQLTKNRNKAYKFTDFPSAAEFINKGFSLSKEYGEV